MNKERSNLMLRAQLEVLNKEIELTEAELKVLRLEREELRDKLE